MRNLMNKKSGFTLIEIIVVLIILGILAAIALPNLFSNVSKSKIAEGLAAFSGYKSQLDGCLYKNAGSEAACASATTYLPSTSAFNFTFTTAPANGAPYYVVKATLSANTNDYFTMTRSSATGYYTCAGVSDFLGGC